jgi:hypothetical protein
VRGGMDRPGFGLEASIGLQLHAPHELDLSYASSRVPFGLCDRLCSQILGTIFTRDSCTAFGRAASMSGFRYWMARMV